MKIISFYKKYIEPYILNILLIAIILCMIFVKFPYVVYKPGGAINLSDRVQVDNNVKINGSYSMSYVAVADGNIPSMLASFVIKNWDRVKKEEITFENTDYETTFKIEQFEMQNSMDVAKIIACQKAHCTANISGKKGYVASITPEAKTNLKILDELISVEGKSFESTEDVSKQISSKLEGDKVSIQTNSGERYATIYKNEEGKNLLGIGVIEKFEYSTNPEIKITSKSSEAGSSGGLILTLAIYDALVDDDLAKGRNIMGTGTIESDGKVGAIGGVKYKLLGAQKAKADIYFIPEENYDEAKNVYDEYKLTFQLIKVSTLDEAISYLYNY